MPASVLHVDRQSRSPTGLDQGRRADELAARDCDLLFTARVRRDSLRAMETCASHPDACRFYIALQNRGKSMCVGGLDGS